MPNSIVAAVQICRNFWILRFPAAMPQVPGIRCCVGIFCFCLKNGMRPVLNSEVHHREDSRQDEAAATGGEARSGRGTPNPVGVSLVQT